MKKEDEYRTKKGEEGEDYVYSIINQVMLQMDYDYKVIKNAFLPFESVYGKSGYLSAEFDFTIFTPFFVFIIEVKNEAYLKCNYSEPLWKLVDETEVSNPLLQNNTHKLVFCSEMKVPREKVITIEILLQNEECKKESPYINDFVFGNKDLLKNMLWLLSSESEETIDFQTLCMSFEDLSKRNMITKENHLDNLKRTEKIETRLRRVLKYIPFRRTDIVRCNRCESGKLIFRDMSYLSTKESERNSGHYALGCTNYRKENVNCDCGLIYADKNKDTEPIKRIKPISIEDRNEWREEERMNKTIFDIIHSLEEQNEKLKNQVSELSREISNNKRNMTEKDKQFRELSDKLAKANDRFETIKDEIGRYKKILGRFYFFTK